jgi:hypothetical protein
MNVTPPSGAEPLSADALLRLGQVCDRFEGAWRADNTPRLEDFLGEATGLERAELLRELLHIEVAWRRRRGEQPRPEDYQVRFPGYSEQRQSAFAGEPSIRTRRPAAAVPTQVVSAEPSTAGQPPTASPPSLEAKTLPPDSVFATADSPDTPPHVPGYEILGVLGRGGMGVVYRARHLGLNRIVALKMILAGAHAGPDDLVRFLAEGEAVAHLQHPNIVQIFESGRHQGVPYFTLEFVPGGSLADKVRQAPLPANEAARLVKHLAWGMAYAHQRGLVHRDLKPENVLLAEDGTPKITDFGLAKRVEGGPGLTQTGAIVGTPSYMAPEQAAGKAKEIGPAADIYGLGAVLYRLMTGRPPFQADTPINTILQVLSDEPVAVRQLVPKCPCDLETICHKCLQKDPRKRYATAEDLAQDFRRFLENKPVRARPITRTMRAWRWCVRNPVLATATGLAIAGLVSAAVLGLVMARQARNRLWQSLADQARAERQAGNRWESLERIAEATKIKASDELRQEAIQTITSPGIRLVKEISAQFSLKDKRGPPSCESLRELAAPFGFSKEPCLSVRFKNVEELAPNGFSASSD